MKKIILVLSFIVVNLTVASESFDCDLTYNEGTAIRTNSFILQPGVDVALTIKNHFFFLNLFENENGDPVSIYFEVMFPPASIEVPKISGESPLPSNGIPFKLNIPNVPKNINFELSCK